VPFEDPSIPFLWTWITKTVTLRIEFQFLPGFDSNFFIEMLVPISHVDLLFHYTIFARWYTDTRRPDNACVLLP
jgi:hypothetical protein